MRQQGILVISHGSRSLKWVLLVDEAVRAVQVPPGVPIFSAFLEIVEGRTIQDGIKELERQGVTEIIAVPFFVSSGSTHLDEIGYALGIKAEPERPTDLVPFGREASVRITRPIDDDPQIAELLVERMGELSDEPEKEIVILVAHGSDEPGFEERWRQGMKLLAERVKKIGGFVVVDYALLLPEEVRKKVICWQRDCLDHAVLIAPLFLSEGYFTGTVIPERLEGLSYRYNGKALLPSPFLSRWIERQIEPFIDESDHFRSQI
ncbi:sirohydrochlorin cobaltochelatase CbiX [Paenibacillus larvae subsp. larvae]|uniref:Sirohydrochlorin cobaltochelatase CbiX n=1 Tax=Paenibacillus larvae subsp. larvae TaxID=147375 RepID=A0A2L1U5G8_9BACL|nr:CbiX/SirB N-terminal domain-containing protein [Paenibacillus larvae]AQT84473.1 cobalamin biosynthesis protein CbiX [Paenibacillus larvae subsp. pulvifaciens]AQZ46468.1 cobalamin biosynthesis protein CbiX [Paenibacillus larvae subsp. pulvifaciens]AVF28172.1 sirohydrochlorin cobaltochelatase CbiX [Paenibacillus larvae subsp. larvae]AVF32675.1 sirohydrochlorin cobaltochelatase CbiX [Paenibacillus larvae subsp. larvae]MBH0342747.1 cobalamin biosynthesis protein CbiX [Paenibacillus larvae]